MCHADPREVRPSRRSDPGGRRRRPRCEQALADSAACPPAQLGKVLLVGGSSRIPQCRRPCRSFIGKEPFKGINPDECVAMGAALQGGVLGGEVKGLLLLDVTPLSLGVETIGDV